MDRTVSEVPAASSMLARVVYTVTQEHENARLSFLQSHAAMVMLGKKTTLLLFNWQEEHGEALIKHLKEVMRSHSQGPLVMGLVGGGDHARRLFKKARPMMTHSKVGQLHIDDAAKPWSRDIASPLKGVMARFQQISLPSAEAWNRLLADSASERASFEEERASLEDQGHEAQQFFDMLSRRRPLATWTLAGTILAVFGLEYAFGGTQSAPVLHSMGALSPERVLDGEVWRLFSCTFLHSGPMHLLFNTYVLWVLGSSLERVLGTWRFLLLYGLSCLGASLLSLVFLDGIAVGASGGLWGLLGAEAVMAWRSQGLLPRAMIEGARRATTFNLGINLLNSFRPHVDMWAHFGGGAVGALLLLSGVLIRGVPRLGELEAEANPGKGGEVAIQTGIDFKVGGFAMTACLLLCLGIALLTGRAWTLDDDFELVRTPLPSLGISLELPDGLELTPSSPGEELSVAVGNRISDPGATSVAVFAGEFSDAAVVAQEQASLIEKLKKVPSGAKISAPPESLTLGGQPGVTVRYAFENNMEEELAFVFLDDAIVRVDVLLWPAFAETVTPGYCRQVLDSVQLLEGSAAFEAGPLPEDLIRLLLGDAEYFGTG